MRVMPVANVEEAIELAATLKQQGEYDWFRGQVQGWAPASSLERRLRNATATQESCIADVEEFLGWATQVPDLAYLSGPGAENETCAIMKSA